MGVSGGGANFIPNYMYVLFCLSILIDFHTPLPQRQPQPETSNLTLTLNFTLTLNDTHDLTKYMILIEPDTGTAKTRKIDSPSKNPGNIDRRSIFAGSAVEQER